jgi:hypothetical protein
MKRRQAQIARLTRLIGDDYFKRYGSEMAKEQREAAERDVEEKLKQLPEEDVPAIVEENEDPEVPQDIKPIDDSPTQDADTKSTVADTTSAP